MVAHSDEADTAGIVLVVSGELAATHQGQEPRKLMRKSPFYVGDTLTLSTNGSGQLRFGDGSVVSLTGGTELVIESFRYGNEVAESELSNVISLVKGGFRTITGAVSKRNSGGYAVKTGVATIGVRGTNFSVALAGDLYVGVWAGGVRVANSGGGLDLGQDQAYNFARVTGDTALPVGMIEPPTALQMTTAPVVDGGHHDESSGESGSEASPGQPGNTEVSVAAVAAPDSTAQEVPAEDGATGIAEVVDDGNEVDYGDLELASGTGLATEDSIGYTGNLSDTPLLSEDTALTSLQTTDTNNDGVPDAITSITDARLSDTEKANLSYWGLMTVGGVNKLQNYSGRTTDATSGTFVLTDNDLLPQDVGFGTIVPQHVLRPGAASVATASFSGYGATLGAWQGSTSTPIVDQTDAADASIVTSIPDMMFWAVTTPPVLSTAAGPMLAEFRNVISFQGGAIDGGIFKVYSYNRVELDTGQIFGRMGVHINGPTGPYFDMAYDGTLNGTVLDLSVDTGVSVFQLSDTETIPAGGEIELALSEGTNGKAIAGYFDFSTTAPDMQSLFHDADGVVLIADGPPLDLRLSAQEQGALSRLGVAVFQGRPNETMVAGPASDPTAGATPPPLFIVSAQIDPEDNLADFVVKQGGSTVPTMGSTMIDTFAVSWGDWNASTTNPAEWYEAGDDPLIFRKVTTKGQWIVAEPTPLVTMQALAANNKTGTWTGTATYFQGEATGGIPVSSVVFNTNIDFGTGDVTTASLTVNASVQTWDASFGTGKLSKGMFELQSSIGQLVVGGGSPTGAAGFLSGAITGANGQGIAAGFHLHEVSNPTNEVNGTFVTTGTITP